MVKRSCSIAALFLVTLSFAGFAEPMTLQNSLNIAMEKSPAIVSAREGVVAADGKLGQAFGALLPNLSVSGRVGSGYTQPYTIGIQAQFGPTPEVITAQNSVDETYSTSYYSATLSQPIFSMALMPALDIAKKSYEIAQQNYRKAVFDLEYNVVDSYYGYLKAQKLYELSNDSHDQATSHLNQANAMYSAGTATKADVLRAEVQVANMELSQIKSKNALAIAKDAFNNALGRTLESDVTLSEKEIASEIATPEQSNKCLDLAFDNRPEWKVFLLNKEINRRSADLAYSGDFPDFSIVGSYANNTSTYQKNDFLNANFYDWTVTANGSWTIFDGLATPSKVKEAQANLAAIESNEESTRNGIILEVKDACLDLMSSIDVIRSAKKTVDLAKENYRIAKERYETGAGSNLELIDAETSYSQANTDLYQAQFDYQVAKARVNQAVGKEVYTF